MAQIKRRLESDTPHASADAVKHEAIGRFFKDHRLAGGLDEATIAQELGLEDVAVLRAYENGEVPIPLDDIFVLTNLLNVTPEETLALIDAVYLKGLV